MAMAVSFEKEFIDAKMESSVPAELCKMLAQRLKRHFDGKGPLGLSGADDAVARFVDSAVAAFFDQDLFRAVSMLLGNAKGSFCLFVSCSLDAHRQVVLAARGQTMSVAFYPAKNLILWASEQVLPYAAERPFSIPRRRRAHSLIATFVSNSSREQPDILDHRQLSLITSA